MSAEAPVGPYALIPISQDETAPWYVIPFDKAGNCTGPKTRDHLIDAVKHGDFTDIYIFSHGWNNDWSDAVGDDPSGVANGGGYRSMIESYINLRRKHKLAYTRPYRPLLIGIFWPSAWLVLPWESAPQIAATDPQIAAAAEAQERSALDELAQLIDPADRDAFYALAKQDKLSEADARELARILAPVYNQGSDTGLSDVPQAAAGQVTQDQLVELWRKLGGREKKLDTGKTGGLLGGVSATPEVAGLLENLDPRMLVRGASVWVMKDRAGTVGAHGVADLLTGLLSASATARVHTIGHSFGCRVLLSAICFPASLPRKVNSALLLQPATSHLCFASNVASSGKPGGYRVAFDRIEQPIMLTFSKEDWPLHNFFHLALVRASDVGDTQIAGGDDEPPNIYAALGGYGPRGFAAGECQTIPINPVSQPYDLGTGAPEVYALNGAGVIHGHGAFNTEETWWALYSQVAR